jgi:transposase
MILVMDNASYHKAQNTEYYPEGKGPETASKGLNAHVLRMAQCTEVEIKRGEATLKFAVPPVEPPSFAHHRVNGGAAPSSDGLDGTVYARSPKGPSSAELAEATAQYLKAHCPQALESKVEKAFAERGWKIIWTPPYCPKFQPIELVWGAGKQRAGHLYRPKRTLRATREDLRLGFYGGAGHGTHEWGPVDIAGCWTKAMGEINSWIAKDLAFEEDGLTGDLLNLAGIDKWTSTEADCLNITDMGKMPVAEANDDELEDAGSDSDGDSEEEEESGSEGE